MYSRYAGLAVLILGLMSLSFVAGAGLQSRFGVIDGGPAEYRVAQFPGDILADEGALSALQAKEAASLTPVETFWQVLNKVRERYYEPIEDENELAYGAAKGLMAALGDPYSRFLDPTDLEAFDRVTQGSLEGIGAVLAPGDIEQIESRTVVILRPFPGGPAAQAGILPGDWIIGVGDSSETMENVIGLTVDEVANRIRGPRGTQVYLRIVRDLGSDSFDVAVTRDRVEVPVVETAHFGNVAYLKLDSFSERSAEKMAEALTELEQEEEAALIIDLRGNSGGLLDAVRDIVSMFVPTGPVVYVQERQGSPKELPVRSELYRGYEFPIVVLVDGASASASEILAGALRDNGRATLIGATTFGKGLVQTVIPLADNRTAMSITTARYLTPAKTDINKEGITPDYGVILSQEKAIDLARGELAHADDDQLQAALTFLREGEIPAELLASAEEMKKSSRLGPADSAGVAPDELPGATP